MSKACSYRAIWSRRGWQEAVRVVEVHTFEEAKDAFGRFIMDANIEGDKVRLQKRGPNNNWDILYRFEYNPWWKRRAHLSDSEAEARSSAKKEI
jgi:hypothetical protein